VSWRLFAPATLIHGTFIFLCSNPESATNRQVIPCN
jgi:hypothetical protein